MADRDAVFVLGLGAQRSATTWLWWYLNTQPDSDLGPLKEYHVWDALGVPELGYFSEQGLLGRARRRLGRRRRGHRAAGDPLRERMQRDPEVYFDHFAGLLAAPGVRLTADITPSYGALGADTLARIRDGFGARGIDVRVVFLMRDPVQRCHSAVMLRRHAARFRPLRGKEAELRRYARSPQARLRTDYPRTLAAAEAVFRPEETFLGFYETLFTVGEVERLSTFLGIEPDPERALNRVHSLTHAARLSARTTAAVRAEYADVYDACAARFPETRELWTPAPGAAGGG